MDDKSLSDPAEVLISTFEKEEPKDRDKKISVNPVVSKVATMYEKLRTAMDYRDEELILRTAIERILKRRILFGGVGKPIAEPLVRELVWARYFPDESVSESIVSKIQKTIELYLTLRSNILKQHHKLTEKTVNQWINQLMSAEIEHLLAPRKKKEAMASFMFNIIKPYINIEDQDEQAKDVQAFIAVRKAYAHDDLPFLRYHLFKQFFGELTQENLNSVSENFAKGYEEINKQLKHPRKDKIFNYVKDKTVVFFILEDLLNIEHGRLRSIYKEETELRRAIYAICQARYAGISSKVRRAIIRSVIFILLTKAFFAFAVEGTYETIFFGRILWTTTAINIGVPPLLMAFIGLFIRTPDRENSLRIFNYVYSILIDGDPNFPKQLSVKIAPDKIKPVLNTAFTILWIATFIVAFGIIFYILKLLHFNFLSMGVFVFFLAIVSFLSYRVNQTAKIYSIEDRKSLTAPILDFIFIPFVRVGRKLTEGISQINIFMYFLDFIFEAPFKGLFGFFEQWFLFLQNKREELE